MRRLILAATALGIAAGFTAPALASPTAPPPLPVTVTGNGNNGVCVTISYQVPQCVDLGQIGATGR